MHEPDPIHQTADHLFRKEAGKMIAVLTKLMGWEQLPVIEDLVQDTLLQAMHTWRIKGLPENPAGWMHRVARNKAIDYLRRKKKWEDISPQYSHLLQSEYSLAATVQEVFGEEEIRDSTVRLLFACCHPSIPKASQVAVSLKILCGLSVEEIARAFFTSGETITKRIYRATQKLRAQKIAFEVPPPAQLEQRLQPVLHCLYLLFNEGYQSATPDALIRQDLCHEAMRLTYELTLHKTTQVPQTHALLALFCFQASRLRARQSANGSIILLKQQDRSLWFQPLIRQGFFFLKAAAHPLEVSAYHLEAAIASVHASAASFAETDWPSIYELYLLLYRLQPDPVVALHKAIAAGYAISPEEALTQLYSIKALEGYYLYFAAIGEMHHLLKKNGDAVAWYGKAMVVAHSKPEQELMQQKVQAILLQ